MLWFQQHEDIINQISKYRFKNNKASKVFKGRKENSFFLLLYANKIDGCDGGGGGI